jgi:hypothetical protein
LSGRQDVVESSAVEIVTCSLQKSRFQPVVRRSGAWRSLASASEWGSEGRRFKSCRPDFFFAPLSRRERARVRAAVWTSAWVKTLFALPSTVFVPLWKVTLIERDCFGIYRNYYEHHSSRLKAISITSNRGCTMRHDYSWTIALFAVVVFMSAPGCLSLGGKTVYTTDSSETGNRISALESRVTILEQAVAGRSAPATRPVEYGR